jgi:iron complex outermembrane receptor protein
MAVTGSLTLGASHKTMGICASTAKVCLALSLLIPTLAIGAQQDTAARLDPVVISVTRGTGRSVLRSPFALSVTQPDSARPGQRHTAIDETLALIPGVAVTNRNNPSQDARISIRGFGARSTFGVRGIRVLRDGMPLTLPDGQTPLDYLSLESVGRVEVIRGAASALYGNASGGVIDIRSATPSPKPLAASVNQWLGENSFERTAFAASGTSARGFYQADAAYSRTDGSRAHSRQRATTAFARTGFTTGSTNFNLTMLALDNPLAENPGALTAEQLRADPSQADGLSVQRNARKAVDQIQVGLSADRAWAGGDAALLLFGGTRTLDNPLTFAIVEVGRHSYGASTHASQSMTFGGLTNRLTIGADLQSQNDLRRNFATCADTIARTSATATCPSITSERGIVTLDQRELVSSAGAYATDELPLGDRFALTTGIRSDLVKFEVQDRLINSANPDDSGKRSMNAVSPVAGMVFRVSPSHSVYANVAGAFETPTATELGNHPDGSAGVNQDLNPQKSVTTEIGAKGYLGVNAHYDAAVYSTRVKDELVPFEIPNSNGRRYFRNAGRTTRRGAEVGGTVTQGPLSLSAAYTYSAFRFDSYRTSGIVYDGNTIPGVPKHHWQSALTASDRFGFAVLESEGAGRLFLDDANTTTGPGYNVANLRFGTILPLRNVGLNITAGVQNLFDRHYAASVAINAARAKYFEPATGRSVFLGVSVSTSQVSDSIKQKRGAVTRPVFIDGSI